MEAVKLVSYGVDTLVLNVCYADTEGQRIKQELDKDLQAALNDYKEQAQFVEEEVPTQWAFRGATLFMKEKGGRVNKKGGGGHWRWILSARDQITMSLARGKQDGGFIAQVRCSSTYLWSCESLRDALAKVWAFLFEFFASEVWLQVSSLDLCADLTWDVASACQWQECFVSRAVCEAEYPGDDGLINGPDQVRRRWKRVETLSWGMHTSPISCRIYNKVREIAQQSHDKVWCYDLWKSDQVGEVWDGEALVWRVEFSFTRPFFRNLETPIEDAWQVLDRLPELWAYAVGHKAGGDDGLPDGWLRYVVPGDDTNRSRWPVHDAWQVVQEAFQGMACEELSLGPLVRMRQREVNVEQGVAGAAGYMSTLAAWLYDLFAVEGIDSSLILHWFSQAMEDYLSRKGRDFQDLVLEKRIIYDLPLRPMAFEGGGV